jgi:hypothetical protein
VGNDDGMEAVDLRQFRHGQFKRLLGLQQRHWREPYDETHDPRQVSTQSKSNHVHADPYF